MDKIFPYLFFVCPILWIISIYLLRNWNGKYVYFGVNFMILIVYVLYFYSQNYFNPGSNFDNLAQFIMIMFLVIIQSFLIFIISLIINKKNKTI